MSLNDVLVSLDLGSLKGLLSSLLLPPVPLLAAVVVGALLIRRRRLGAGWALLWTGVLGTYLSCTTLLGWPLMQMLLRPPPALSTTAIAELRSHTGGGRTAIVVLGAGRDLFAPEYGVSNLNRLSMERLRYGLWLSRATGLPVAFSGGVGYGAKEGASEAEVAQRIASSEFGRPLRWTETRSRDTTENARFTVRQLSEAGIDRIVLVTHGFHMRRAVGAFERAATQAQVQVTVVPAPMGLAVYDEGWLPSIEGFTQTRIALREWFGRLAGA